MTRENWQAHIDGLLPLGIVRPSLNRASPNMEAYRAWLKEHKFGCRECRDRAMTRRANRAGRDRRAAYASLGMVRAVGALGGVYYE